MKLAEQDLQKVLARLSTAALILTSEQLARGAVRGGIFTDCLMHYLSFTEVDDFAVYNKQSFVTWIRSLGSASGADTLELAARRIVRGLDEAHRDEDGITLDAPISNYYRRYPFCYVLTKEQSKEIIVREIIRRTDRRPEGHSNTRPVRREVCGAPA